MQRSDIPCYVFNTHVEAEEAMGAALTQLGVQKERVIKYESAMKMDKYVLLVHGDDELAQKVRAVLRSSKAWQADWIDV